jgi:hypothetical protein
MKIFKFHPLTLPSPITIFEYDIKVIRKVRKRRHQKPLFGHIGDEISKNRA